MSTGWKDLFPDEDIEMQLQPEYPFTSPGEPIVLYDGPATDIAATERSCKIALVFGDKPWLRWSVEPDPTDLFPRFPNSAEITLRRHRQDWTVTAHGNVSDGGWLNHAEFETPGAQLSRVVVHWMNLPDILANTRIATESPDGSSHCWGGRWLTEVDGWRIAIDRRHDYREATPETEVASVFMLTHVMEVRRVDGASFEVDAVKQVLECLRVCLSFGFGRWVAPTLPVGYDSTGVVAWEEWTAPICHPMEEVGAAWLSRVQREDVAALIKCALPAFLDPNRRGITRFQMVSAVQAVEAGFVDQRILTTFPALENLEWFTLVRGGEITLRDDRYPRNWPAKRRLRRLLQRAHIPAHIDPVSLPRLADFAKAEKLRNGPEAVTEVRNRLVHPRDPQQELYSRDGIVQDAWLLSRHYLNLLILHSIGYQGSYVRLLPPFGRSTGAKPVPWTATTTP